MQDTNLNDIFNESYVTYKEMYYHYMTVCERLACYQTSNKIRDIAYGLFTHFSCFIQNVIIEFFLKFFLVYIVDKYYLNFISSY